MKLLRDVFLVSMFVLPITGCTEFAAIESLESVDAPKLQLYSTEYIAEPIDGHVKHEFEIKNVGNRDLIIENVVSTCGCTVAKSDQTVVPPGETTTVLVDLSVSPTSRESAVFLHTNDPQKNVLQLRIAAEGSDKSIVSFAPTVLRLRSAPGEVVSREVLVRLDDYEHRCAPKRWDFTTSSPAVEVIISPQAPSQSSLLVWKDDAGLSVDESHVRISHKDRCVVLQNAKVSITAPTAHGLYHYFARTPQSSPFRSSVLSIALIVE